MFRSTPTLGSRPGVRSIWNEDISITWTRFSAGGSSERIAVPMLPPICTSRPAAPSTWVISAVVVDLPLVPVIATKGASGASARRSRQNSAMSPTIATPASWASRDAPVRFRVGQRHAGAEHQRLEPRPVGRAQVPGGDALRDGPGEALRAVVPGEHAGRRQRSGRGRWRGPSRRGRTGRRACLRRW